MKKRGKRLWYVTQSKKRPAVTPERKHAPLYSFERNAKRKNAV
jgi:hypothetical protein